MSDIKELIKAARVDAAVIGNLPERPGYNGSILMIDDEEAERISKDIYAAIDAMEKHIAELGEKRKHSFEDLFEHFCYYAGLMPDNFTEREMRLAKFAFYSGGHFPPEDHPGWETDDDVHPLCREHAQLGVGA